MSTIADLLVRVAVQDDTTAGMHGVVTSIEKEAGGLSSRIGGKMQSIGSTMTKSVTLPIVAGFTLALKAGAEEEQQMHLLAEVIRKQVPNATQEMIDKNEEWITSIQNTTGVVDGELREIQQKFIAAGVSVEDSQMMAATAIDTAVASGKELNSIADAMVKGVNGQTAGFSRLGVQVKNADGSMKSFDEILVDLQKHQGTAAASMDNAAGRATLMKLKFADMTEDIGMILIPILDKLVGFLTKIVDWFSNLSPAAKQFAVVLLGVAAAVGPVMKVGGMLVSNFGMIGKAFLGLSKLLMANPWMALIAATIALVTLIVMNWDKIVDFLKKTWKWIQDAAAAVWTWMKNTFKAGLDFIVNLFRNWPIIGELIKHWDKIKEGVSEVIGWVKEQWDKLIGWFKELPGRMTKAISGLFDGIKTMFKNAVNWLIRKWNNFSLGFDLPGILGGGRIAIDTPNIPEFHTGGVFAAPPGQREGLALLEDGERVVPRGGSRETGQVYNFYGDVYGDDGFLRKVREANARNARLGFT